MKFRAMHPALQQIDHRPWPLPGGGWRWRQSWLELAFIHYRVDGEKLRGLLPKGVQLQEFDGSGWIGVVPFQMAGVMRRPWPDLPVFSSFPELNVRTYVEVGGKPGVWFFSLDADSWPVVFGGRRIYGLPYHRAKMRLKPEEDGISFRSTRRASGVTFAAHYRPAGEAFLAKTGTFEHWVTERYCLYARSPDRGLSRVEIHHGPWPLQRAEVVIKENGMLAAAGIAPVIGDPICHFSKGVDAVSFAEETVCV